MKQPTASYQLIEFFESFTKLTTLPIIVLLEENTYLCIVINFSRFKILLLAAHIFNHSIPEAEAEFCEQWQNFGSLCSQRQA